MGRTESEATSVGHEVVDSMEDSESSSDSLSSRVLVVRPLIESVAEEMQRKSRKLRCVWDTMSTMLQSSHAIFSMKDETIKEIFPGKADAIRFDDLVKARRFRIPVGICT